MTTEITADTIRLRANYILLGPIQDPEVEPELTSSFLILLPREKAGSLVPKAERKIIATNLSDMDGFVAIVNQNDRPIATLANDTEIWHESGISLYVCPVIVEIPE